MSQNEQIYRGPLSTIPVLKPGQFGFTNDTNQVWIGTNSGTNVLVGGSGSGTVTSVSGARGTRTSSGSAQTTAATLWGDEPINAQTGTSYTVADADRGSLTSFSNTSAVAVAIAQAGTGGNFANGWYADYVNLNTGVVTVTPTTSTIDGQTTYILRWGEGIRIESDGTNYQITRKQVQLAEVSNTPTAPQSIVHANSSVTVRDNNFTVNAGIEVVFEAGADLIVQDDDGRQDFPSITTQPSGLMLVRPNFTAVFFSDGLTMLAGQNLEVDAGGELLHINATETLNQIDFDSQDLQPTGALVQPNRVALVPSDLGLTIGAGSNIEVDATGELSTINTIQLFNQIDFPSQDLQPTGGLVQCNRIAYVLSDLGLTVRAGNTLEVDAGGELSTINAVLLFNLIDFPSQDLQPTGGLVQPNHVAAVGSDLGMTVGAGNNVEVDTGGELQTVNTTQLLNRIDFPTQDLQPPNALVQPNQVALVASDLGLSVVAGGNVEVDTGGELSTINLVQLLNRVDFPSQDTQPPNALVQPNCSALVASDLGLTTNAGSNVEVEAGGELLTMPPSAVRNGYRFNKIVYITTVGVTNYTPTQGVRCLFVEAWGGGASGGGAATAASSAAAGGGGGSGAYSAKVVTGSNLGINNYDAVVGAGGTAGSVGNNPGNAGGITSMAIHGSSTFVAALGGSPGFGGAAGTVIAFGGAGGPGGQQTGASAGDIRMDGSTGQTGLVLSATVAIGGAGGGGVFGEASNAPNTSNGFGPGTNGYAAGGVGGVVLNGATATAGGVGNQGLLRIWEFF